MQKYYEKIFAIAKAVSKRIYYHEAYYKGITNKTNLWPYEIWRKKLTICAGYSNLCELMLKSIGIPCMTISADNHAYNAAYSKSKGRWVFFDATWISGNRKTVRGTWKKGKLDLNKFDMPCKYMAQIGHHQIYQVPGITKKNVSYTINTCGSYKARSKQRKAFKKPGKWYIVAANQVRKKTPLKIVSEVAGYKVKRIEDYAFCDNGKIRKVYLPKRMKKVGKYAFFVTWKGRQLKTTVITKAPRKNLNLKNGWGNRYVRIKR